MARKPRQPYHEEFAAQIIEDLKQGAAPWQKPWKAGELQAPHNPVSGTVYKGVNRVMLARRGYDDPRWMTYRQANSIDCQVRKGEKGQPIVFWQFTREEPRLDEQGAPVLDAEGEPIKDSLALERPIVRFSTVFHATQLEGDLPPLDPTIGAPTWNPHDMAETILANSDASIAHDQRNRAYYSVMNDAIHLPPRENFEAADAYYATALHELGHWTGHPSRQNREFGPFGSETYAREELRAEIASWMLGQDIGVGHDPGQHLAYVDSWVSILEKDPFEIVSACRDAEKIKQFVMDMEREQVSEQSRGGESFTQRAMDATAEAQTPKAAPAPAAAKTYLDVPYREKNAAKAVGARWDREAKRWFAPEGADLTPLSRWVPDQSSDKTPERAPTHTTTMAPAAEFAEALRDMGLDLGGADPIMDGQIHRVPLLGESSSKPDGAYCGHLDGVPAGFIQNHRTGERSNWKATGHRLTREQKEKLRTEAAQRREARERLRESRHEKAAERAAIQYEAAREAPPEQAYLQAKGVPGFGARMDAEGSLLVPGRDTDGRLMTIQTITPEGKRFETGARKHGAHFMIDPDGRAGKGGPICICEGFATAASVHMATGAPTVAAFDAGNLEPVARALRVCHPEAPLLIMADNDHARPRNVGMEKAGRAADAVGGRVVAPEFNKAEKAQGLTDWNDLHASRGLNAVKDALAPAIAKATRSHEQNRSREYAQSRAGMEL